MRLEVDDGVQLYVQDLGRGPAVVLVAGFGLDHRVWDAQVRSLATRHRVVCVDQRGHGCSDAPLDGYDLRRLGSDLLEVLARLDVDSYTLVGWSFGGQVAFEVASRRPTQLEQVILVASNAVRASRSADFPFGLPTEETLPSLLEAERVDRFRARRSTIESGFANPPDAALVDYLVGCSLEMPSWAAVACYESMLRSDLMHGLRSVVVPVHQIIGSADPVHSARGARWLRSQLAEGQMIVLDDVGHYPMFESPDAFDRALASLLP